MDNVGIVVESLDTTISFFTELGLMLARLRKRGAQLVGEVIQFMDSYRLYYIGGPEGILIGLAEQLGMNE